MQLNNYKTLFMYYCVTAYNQGRIYTIYIVCFFNCFLKLVATEPDALVYNS